MTLEKNLRVEVLERPASLSPEQRAQLIDEFVKLACQTTGGNEWRSYEPAINGWREYYNGVGARPQDYDRLMLIYDGDLLVHFTGIVLFELEPSLRFIYVRTAMTLKQYHGTGLLKTAILGLLSKEWLRSIGEAYLILRTANPIVYEATNHLVTNFLAGPDLEFICYPTIKSDGGLDFVPEHIRELAMRVAKKTSPDAILHRCFEWETLLILLGKD